MRMHSHNAAENRRYHFFGVKSGQPVSVRREKMTMPGLKCRPGCDILKIKAGLTGGAALHTVIKYTPGGQRRSYVYCKS